MARQFSLPEIIPPVELLAPAADAAGRTSGYVNLGKADKAYIVCHINQGNAATVQLMPLQAQDVSGTGSKAIGATQVWTDLNESAGDQLTKQANAANYTTDAGLHSKVVVFTQDVGYYIDGVRYSTAGQVKFGPTGLLQPYLSVYKPSDTGVATLVVDYVRLFSNRA